MLATGAVAQVSLAPTWNQQSPATTPPLRYAPGMTYDTAHGQVVMFGGFGTSNVLGDTWLWNGSNWTQVNPATSPSARSNQTMVYDAAQGEVVMFGGSTSGQASSRMNDTWLWNGTTWSNFTSSTVPPARSSAAMAYDPVHGQVVMFGGLSSSGSYLGDTWLWNGVNWVLATSLATSPSARFGASMTFDAALGEVILFGGSDVDGDEDNDTWAWNGSTWTQLTPAGAPLARDSAGIAYDTVLGQVVMFGGEVDTSGTYLNDTWTLSGNSPSNLTWTQQSIGSSPAVRTNPGMAYDTAQGNVVLFGGYSNTNPNGGYNDTWTFGTPQNFGSVNVCPSGASTPAPCSSTLSLTYTFAGNTNVGAPSVVTQGTPGLDFAQANGGNCSGTIQGGSSCTLLISFTPQLPGLRSGAVNFLDNLGNVLATTLIYGVGQGPEVAFGPAVSGITILNGPSLENVLSTGSFTPNPRGMAADTSGNLYIADPSNERLLKRAANGTTTTVGTLSSPQGVAIDGAGDLFVADTGLRAVVEIPAGCILSSCQTPVYNPSSADPEAVAVDGMGNLYVADPDAGGVVEVPAGCASISCYIPIGSGWHSVSSLAVDAAGDVFVPDSSAGSFSEMPAGCTVNSCRIPIGSFIVPEAAAVDAAGDVYVSDFAAAGGMGQVSVVPAGCASSSCQIPLVTGIGAYDLAVDELGQVYVADGGRHQVLQINQSQAPSETFADTNVGSTSADSPQSFYLLNVGNQTLSAVLPGFGLPGVNFVQISGSGTPPDCLYNFSLVPGARCNASIDFQPQQSGALTATASATDNNLNAASATQSIALSGNGIATGVLLSVSGLGNGTVVSTPPGINCTLVNGGVQGTCTGNFSDNSLVTLQATPSGGYVFQAWGGVCSGSNPTCTFAITGGSAVTATFTAAPNYTVAVTNYGTGTGSVISNPAGISCSISGGVNSGTCTASFPAGQAVTLAASPNAPSTFYSWGSDCTSAGTGAVCTVNAASNVAASFVAPGTSLPGLFQPITAGVVYGQGGSFTTGTANIGGVASATGLNNPTAVAVDASGNVYVADRSNSRVLYYPRGSTTATRVYGQNGSFTSTTPNNGGVTANSLGGEVFAVAVDASGNLYIADGANNRVLFYPNGSTTATRVYGQGGSFTSNTQNLGGISANSLDGPGALALDSSGGLYVGDTFRALYFPAGSTTATRVYGQGGSFTTNTSNKGGVSANSLASVSGMALDSTGGLYLSDVLNARVLYYPAGSTTATKVYGQGGSFTTNTANLGGISADSLNQPGSLAVDGGNNLYVADDLSPRVLFFPFGSTTATRVYGQNGSFTIAIPNNGGVSANSIWQPQGIALDASGNLYVADLYNNRVLEYGSFGSSTNVCPTGVSTPAPCSSTVSYSYNAPVATSFGGIQAVTQGVSGLDFTPGAGSTCTGTVSAGTTCLVNVTFTPLAPGLRSGAVTLFDNNGNPLATAPAYGIAQAPAAAFGPGTQSVLPVTGLNRPANLALDAAGNVFIANSLNNQIVKLTPGGVQSTVPTSGLSDPRGVAVDGAGDLFISDAGNTRVVEIPAGCSSSTCQVTVPTAGLANTNGGLAVDGAGDIFIADTGNSRVVEVTPAGVQTTVPATGLHGPFGVAVDAAGDVFIADTYGNQIVEVTAGGVQTTVPTVGVTAPEGVWADAAGDVFIADSIPNSRIVEVPAGGGAQITVYTGNAPEGVVADGKGDLVIADTFNNRIEVIDGSQPPAYNFALANVGALSPDSPYSASIQNVGNQPLTGTRNFSFAGNFVQDVSSTCSPAFSLSPGAACAVNVDFLPQATGYLTGSLAFSDNTFNLSPLVALQTVNLSGIGGLNGQAVTTAVPDVAGLTQAAAIAAITSAGLTSGGVYTAASEIVPVGSAITSNPAAGTQVSLGSAVKVQVSSGQPVVPTPNPLSFENNYFVTGDYAVGAVYLHGVTAQNGLATGIINIPDLTSCGCGQGVPDGADIVDAFLYWTTVENTATPSGATGTFLPSGTPAGAAGYTITGQQVGSDIANYNDGTYSGTLRVYRADINTYFQAQPNWNGARIASGNFSVSLPEVNASGGQLTVTEGASMVVIYRVLSPNFPLKAVVIYDGSGLQTTATTQTMQGFYDAAGPFANVTSFATASGNLIFSNSSVLLAKGSSQYAAPLSANTAYSAVILSTPVANSDNDGILDAWKAGPATSDFYGGQPGYYDVKTGGWVPLPGAKHGQKDLFVQLDYMCGTVLANGACDPSQENLFPAPDALGNDPLAMVTSAFAADGVTLHLQVGNAVPEDICTDNASTPQSQLCQFPSQPGVLGWKNSLEYSKLWPRNYASCAAGGDCSPRFPYGQKDSYHYVLFGHSLAIPAWNSRYGTLTAITVVNGTTTISTADRGAGINACPSRITISGVLGNPSLNGVYNTSSCPDTKTILVATPGVPNWSYPNNTLPEPVIGLTSGTVTSISGYSDLGGSDSAVTLGLWETVPNQDMSKRANVIAGTLFHEIGHTLGLSHGGLYYQTPGSYVPTFDVNCKPNYQSVMNYLFQLDLLGPNATVAYSNQSLATLSESSLSSVTQLTDGVGNPATFPTSTWYTPNAPSPGTSAATLHCDGTPLTGDTGYRVTGPIAPITPAWSSGQNIGFDGVSYTQMLGYNDVANMDLRQVGATGGEFASLASTISFGSSSAPLTIAAGGSANLGAGGSVALGSGGSVSLASGGIVTLGSGGIITLGSGGIITMGSGGSATLNNPSTIAPGSSGIVTLGSGGIVTLGSGGIITMGSGGTVTLGGAGIVTLGSGGIITLGSGGTITIPSIGGSYPIDSAGGIITLGSGGNVTLNSGGTATLTGTSTLAPGSGGIVTLGSGGIVTLGSGGIITMGSGGIVTLGSGGIVTLGSGGIITMGSGGIVTLGSGGIVTLGSGGIVTLGSGGDLSGSGGIVTLGSGGSASLGAGGTVTLAAGGIVTLGSGGIVTLGSGGIITMGSGGIITMGSGGTVSVPQGGSPGIITLGSGGTQTVLPGTSYTLNSSGGIVTFGSGGSVSLASGGIVTMGSGGIITMGSGGIVTLGSGGIITMGSGGVVTLGSGGIVTLGSGGSIALGGGGIVTLGSGGASTNEMTYETANSIVRPPSSPTETPVSAAAGAPVVINWTAPAFGVVATYTIYRSADGGTPVAIGSVSGVNGNPPATTFIDTNPDVTATTVAYTISTTTLPIPVVDPAPRQSAPSPPAVLTNNQTIVLGALPSSVSISSSTVTVTATAQTNGAANGLQVNFGATGTCTVGNQSMNTASGVSSAAVTLNSTGSCTITASQPGTNPTEAGNPPYYNAANSVSGTFMILPAGSTTQSQTIDFPQLPNVQYGGAFSLSAASSSGLTVTFTATGPCTTSGSISGVGVCSITASAPANSTYSAASVTQSFTIFPAVLLVTANNLSIASGQQIPALTYTYSGFVNNQSASVISGTPALSTTATAGSPAGTYPITVSTGTLAASNYSFLYMNGTLTISGATATINVTPYGVNYNGLPHTATGTATGIGGVSLSGLALGSTTHTAAGTYSDTWTFTDSTGVYLSASGTVTDVIHTVPLAVTASSASMTYGGPVPPIIPAYAGFVNNENASKLTTQPVCATAATSTSPVGTYISTCSNAADPNYSISYVAGAVQVGQASTTTAVTSSSTGNTSTFGQSVTFTAIVTPQYSGTTPTGTVAFYSNGTQIGTGALSQGQAAFTTSSLPAGAAQSITAIYSGDGNFTSSTSPAISQTVRATPILSLNPLFVSFGDQNVNTTSSGIKITLTNAGDAALTPITIGLSGSFPADFKQTNNCPSSLGYAAPNNTCTITVVFAPVDTGALSAVLTITSNDDGTSGSQQYVSLAGGGVSTIVGGSLFSNGIFATAFGCDSVDMRGGSTVDSFDSSLGFSASHTLSGGNVGANGTVNLSGQNTAIYGAVSVWNQNCTQVPSGFSSNGGGQPTGGLGWLNGPGNYPPPPMPNTPPISTQNIAGSCGSLAGCTNTGSRTVSLAPGSYGNLSFSGGVTTHLSAGTYNINSLALSGNSVLYVDSGPVYVNIAGASLNGGNPAMDFSGGTVQNPTQSPANLQFSYSGSQGVNLSGGSGSYATVYAPNAPVNLSGGSDFFGSIIGSIFTNSGGVALHYDRHLAVIKAGDYIWFNAVINNVKGLPTGSNPAQVKLYMTDSTISFTANGTSYSLPVPNAVVTFNSTSALGTSFSNTSSRWSTSIPAADLTGNTFVSGIAFQVPANFPAGIQNVSWSAAFSTDTPGITLQWQWGASVYSTFSTTYATTTNSNALGVNPEDGTADANGKDAAGTPETYKADVLFGGTGCGGNDYAGHLTSGAGVVPSLAPVSVSPSSLDFGTQAQGVKSTTPLTAILTNNDSVAYAISSIAVSGTDASDFAITNTCSNSLAAGASCTISVTFTPGDVDTRTAKIVITDGAGNSPQTVYLTGTGH